MNGKVVCGQIVSALSIDLDWLKWAKCPAPQNTNDILYYIANILQIAGGHPISPNEFLSQDQYRNFPRETRNSVQRSRLTGMATGRKILNFEIVCRNTMKDRGKPVCSAEIWNKTGQSQSLAVNAGEAWHPFPQHTCCLKALWGLFIIIMTKVSPKHDFKQLFFLLVQNFWNIQNMAWAEF